MFYIFMIKLCHTINIVILLLKSKVAIRPVLNGTVAFFVSLSRRPLGNIRGTKMSRFQKVDKEITKIVYAAEGPGL